MIKIANLANVIPVMGKIGFIFPNTGKIEEDKQINSFHLKDISNCKTIIYVKNKIVWHKI